MFEEGKNENAASPGEDDSYEVLTSIENEQITGPKNINSRMTSRITPHNIPHRSLFRENDFFFFFISTPSSFVFCSFSIDVKTS